MVYIYHIYLARVTVDMVASCLEVECLGRLYTTG